MQIFKSLIKLVKVSKISKKKTKNIQANKRAYIHMLGSNNSVLSDFFKQKSFLRPLLLRNILLEMLEIL